MASVTFPVNIGGNGSTVTDDSNTSTGLANGGHRTRFVPALSQMVAVANTVVAIGQNAVNASTNGGTSVTSLTIGAGSRTLTTQTGKTWFIGQFVIVANSLTPANYMIGQILAYDTGTGSLQVNVTATGGSGTFSTWSISVTAMATVTTDLYVPGKLSQGVATPLAGLHTYSAISGGAPASSGSAADPNALARFGAASVVLDVGAYASGAFWMQPRASANYATNYDLYIGPNGGALHTKSVRSTKATPSISAGALTLDCSAGALFVVSLNANITTMTISNPPPAGYVLQIQLHFIGDGTARTVSWPASVKWPGGTPTSGITSINGRASVINLTTHDGGTSWFADFINNNYF
jgi:hypothetical protein